ncbi:hypothetical protein A9Y87_02755 [Salmonella enterica subsp. enterica]|nr:hypothetical protein A9Y87_02755 [Salmonella enterica subsp. enterica]
MAEDIAGNKISKEVSFTIDTIVSDPSIDLLDAVILAKALLIILRVSLNHVSLLAMYPPILILL